MSVLILITVLVLDFGGGGGYYGYRSGYDGGGGHGLDPASWSSSWSCSCFSGTAASALSS